LREALSTLGNIQVAFLYGSTAKGTDFPSSDIDLMVIGEVNLDVLDKMINTIEEEIGRTVNYTLFSAKEWQNRVKQRNSFVKDVLIHKKIFLLGDINDLSAVGKGRAH
jgi:predicted nucleotidyltransferase